MIKQVIWSSMIDWPNENCTVLFLDGCNFCCSYCHNKNLSKELTIEFENVLPRLLKRKPFIDHVILSGGEPTISDDFKSLVETLYDNGFKVGIHTNGSNYRAFKKVADKISFIGLDIKCEFMDYGDFIYDYSKVKIQPLIASIENYLQKLNNYDYDVRTTIDEWMTKQDLISIAQNLKTYDIEKWTLQYEFHNNKIYKHNIDAWYIETLNELNKILKVEIR